MPPIGDYKSFSTCVAAQKRKGKGDEAARRICGEIEKRSQSKNKSKKRSK